MYYKIRFMKLFNLLLFCLSGTLLFAQGRFDEVEIKEHKLTDNIYMLEGAGGNVGILISDDEVLMIDDQFAPLSEKLMAKIKELSGGKTTQLINTHWHGDHTGGNENFGNDGAMIIAHENVRKRMSTPIKRSGQVQPSAPEIALPVITFQEGMELHFLNEPIIVKHVHNAHTDGDSFVFLPESNILHMGDCFFNGRFPYIDLSSGGSLSGALVAAKTGLMLADEATQIIPGHGSMATREDLVTYEKFLTVMTDRITKFVAEGGTKETMDPAVLTKGYEHMASSFITAERFANIILQSTLEENP